jgi:hypothetical protein
MTRDERTVVLAILVTVFYAVLAFIQTGMMIFPFPLNETIFLTVAIIFATRHYKTNFFTVLFSSAYATMALLTSEFFWSIFMNEQQFQEFYSGSSPDVIALTSSVLMIIWAGVQIVRPENKIRSLWFLLFFILLSLSLLWSEPLILLPTLLVPFVLRFKYSDIAPFHLLWLLLALLLTSKLIMLRLA